jgi:hypothetical protein
VGSGLVAPNFYEHAFVVALRDACLRTRKTSLRVYCFSVLIYAVGGWFAFIQPALAAG